MDRPEHPLDILHTPVVADGVYVRDLSRVVVAIFPNPDLAAAAVVLINAGADNLRSAKALRPKPGGRLAFEEARPAFIDPSAKKG